MSFSMTPKLHESALIVNIKGKFSRQEFQPIATTVLVLTNRDRPSSLFPLKTLNYAHNVVINTCKVAGISQ